MDGFVLVSPSATELEGEGRGEADYIMHKDENIQCVFVDNFQERLLPRSDYELQAFVLAADATVSCLSTKVTTGEM